MGDATASRATALKHEKCLSYQRNRKTDNRLENLELWIKSQPNGQRVEDHLRWAREIIALYGDLVERASLVQVPEKKKRHSPSFCTQSPRHENMAHRLPRWLARRPGGTPRRHRSGKSSSLAPSAAGAPPSRRSTERFPPSPRASSPKTPPRKQHNDHRSHSTWHITDLSSVKASAPIISRGAAGNPSDVPPVLHHRSGATCKALRVHHWDDCGSSRMGTRPRGATWVAHVQNHPLPAPRQRRRNSRRPRC